MQATAERPEFLILVPSLMSSTQPAWVSSGPYRLEELVMDGRKHVVGHRLSAFQAVISDTYRIGLACRNQSLKTVKVPSSKGATASSCGVDAGQNRDMLLWDARRLPSGGISWTDFWNIPRHPGKRALPLSPRLTLEVALLADNVPPGDVYRVLSTEEGVARAFHKLDQIRPYLTWWKDARDAARIMSDGGALMAILPAQAASLLLNEAVLDRFTASRNGQLAENYAIAVVNSAHDVRKNAAIWQLRTNPPHLEVPPIIDTSAKPALVIDDDFWLQHGEDLQKRFNQWLNQE